jgi:hypothetical protein
MSAELRLCKRLKLTLFSCLGDTLSIVRVDDEDDTLSVLEICHNKRLPVEWS